LSDGGYLIEIGGKSHVAYLTGKGDAATGMRLNVAGSTIAFSPDYDPTSLRTDVAVKLVKCLVPDGARVKNGEHYAEIEVMKMFMPLKVEEAGIVAWKSNEGAALAPGDILATLELENPENVVLGFGFRRQFANQRFGLTDSSIQCKESTSCLASSFGRTEWGYGQISPQSRRWTKSWRILDLPLRMWRCPCWKSTNNCLCSMDAFLQSFSMPLPS
jgi:uncharacterized protein